MRNFEGGADMNRITEEWQKNRNRSIFTGAIVSAFLSIFVLLGMLASVWVAFAWVPVLALGGYIIISAVRDYRRKMAVWLALPDAVRRSVNALCAEERQTAYYRLLRGYLTPHGILVQDGFLPWEHIVSIAFWEKGREFSRAADWWNFLSGAVGLLGHMDSDYIDPESPAQCRITVREGDKERLYCLGLSEESFSDGGVERLIEQMKQISSVPLTFR